MDDLSPRDPIDESPRPGPAVGRDEFARRALIAAGVVLGAAAIAAVAVAASSVFLLLFGAILLAILLRAAVDALARRTGLQPGRAYAIVLVVLALAMAGAVYFVGATVADQFSNLTEELPKSAARVREYLKGSAWGREVLRWAPAAKDAVAGQPEEAASHVAQVFSTTFGAAGDAVLLLFLTIYLAGSPDRYVDGVVRLVPIAKRPRAREVLEAVGGRLRGWMLGQLVAIATVGLVSAIGLKLIGAPQFLILALTAGLFTAIPYLGPIIGSGIGVLAMLTQGPAMALKAFLVFSVAETLEGYVVTPLVQQKLAELPPVVTLFAIALAGVLFGVPGLIVAAPLAVAIQTSVEELYVKDTLGDHGDETTPD